MVSYTSGGLALTIIGVVVFVVIVAAIIISIAVLNKKNQDKANMKLFEGTTEKDEAERGEQE